MYRISTIKNKHNSSALRFNYGINLMVYADISNIVTVVVQSNARTYIGDFAMKCCKPKSE